MTLQERLEVSLFQDVPSAFWLDPGLWDNGPHYQQHVPPGAPLPAPVKAHQPRLVMPGKVAFWAGKRVVESFYRPDTMLFQLRLEDGSSVQLPEHELERMRRYH